MQVAKINFKSTTRAQEFVASLRETGFAVITNHPIAAENIFATYDTWAAFFASQEKMAYRFKPQEQSGYFPLKMEKAKEASIADLKEFFHIYPQTDLPKSCESLSRTLYKELQILSLDLLHWIDEQSPKEVSMLFSQKLTQMVEGSPLNLLRILHYPPIKDDVDESAGAVRAAAHEDINLITLLVAASAPGLEVRSADGQWFEVPCNPGDIVVNAGDMLQEASHGYYRSTTHRVVNPNDPNEKLKSRYSMPMFVHPRSEVVLSERYTAGEYLQQRLREINLK